MAQTTTPRATTTITSYWSLNVISIWPLTVSKIESLLWEEVHRRFRKVNGWEENAPPKLEGSLLQTRLKVTEGHFAMGLSTDEPVRFQGFHAENLLVVLDEACGIPEEIWDAIEGVCVGGNNRVLAISNPLSPSGRFYGLFKSPRWKTCTISALRHPNVTRKRDSEHRIPGAVTREAVEDRIAEWCEEEQGEPKPNSFLWEGRSYRPNGLFLARVLGEFPSSGEDSLFDLDWIEKAMERVSALTSSSHTSEACIVAVDVARFGSDETVLVVRRGDAITRLIAYQNLDTMEVARRVQELALAEGATSVVVDAVGIGAGVVDRLAEQQLAGLIPVNFGTRVVGEHNSELYTNLRAQTFWALRESLRGGKVALPRDEILRTQLMNLRYRYSVTGQIQIESKDDIKRRGLSSPDRADALALAFCPLIPGEYLAFCPVTLPLLREQDEPVQSVHWSSIGVW